MKTFNEIDWSKSHNGVMLCSYSRTVELMPEVTPILSELVEVDPRVKNDYLFDVKIHMLMPGEFPCIPNWHQDFVPRDENKKKLPHLITGEPMYLWVSGEPLTEFIQNKVVVPIKPMEWVRFTQRDVHRGVESKIHTWRCFIRAIPGKFVHPGTMNVGQNRRHTQVYLDAAKFKW